MPERFEELPDHTKRFLKELREDEVKELSEVIDALRTIRRLGRWGKWIAGSIIVGFVSVVLLGESIEKIWNWIRKWTG